MHRRVSFLVVLALVLSALLAGCGSSTSSPEQVATDYFGALTTGDWATVAKLQSSRGGAFEPPTADEERIVKALTGRMAFDLGEAEVQGDEATIAVDVTMPDMDRLAVAFMDEVLPLAVEAAFSEDVSEEQLQLMVEEKFVEILNDPGLALSTYEGVVRLVKEAGGWKVLTVDGLDMSGDVFDGF